MPPLKLKWVRTWADVPRDFSALAPESALRIGRVHETHSGTGTMVWVWSCSAFLSEHSVWLNGIGREDTKDAACRALEAYWFEALARVAAKEKPGHVSAAGLPHCPVS